MQASNLGIPILAEELQRGVRPADGTPSKCDESVAIDPLLADVGEHVPHRITRDPDQTLERTIQFQDQEDRGGDRQRGEKNTERTVPFRGA